MTSEPPPPALEIQLARHVHPGLHINVALTLGHECGVIFGPSGAGKTTLIRMIAGLETPDQGFVRLNGETVFNTREHINRPLRLRRIAMVFQHDLLFPHMSVAANIRFGLKASSRPEAEQRLAEVASLCGVNHLLDRRPETLSGGERQRVGLARALAPRPRLLLCDEPLSALDLPSRHALVDQIRRIQAAESVPILYVTHSPDEALALGSRLFLLNKGKLVAQGHPLEILASNHAGSPVSLEGVRNVFHATVSGDANGGATCLQLNEGPTLIVAKLDLPPSSRVVVSVLAEEVLLSRGPIEGLSARNAISGVVDRVFEHDDEAEVLVRTGGLTWICSVVRPAVSALGLNPGVSVHMIIKARSCHIRPYLSN